MTLKADDAALQLPEKSLSVAVKLCVPFVNVAVAKLHAPLASALAVPSCVAPSNTFTVLLASAVPVSISVASLVIPSPTLPLSLAKDKIVGTAGTAVPITGSTGCDARLVLPAASVLVAVKAWGPSVSWLVVYVHAPPISAATLPNSVAPS